MSQQWHKYQKYQYQLILEKYENGNKTFHKYLAEALANMGFISSYQGDSKQA